MITLKKTACVYALRQKKKNYFFLSFFPKMWIVLLLHSVVHLHRSNSSNSNGGGFVFNNFTNGSDGTYELEKSRQVLIFFFLGWKKIMKPSPVSNNIIVKCLYCFSGSSCGNI